MCSDAIRDNLSEKPKDKFCPIELEYPRLRRYGLHSHHVLSACEVAFSLCKNKNRRGVPRVVRAFLKLDNQSYQLNHLLLRIPTAPRHFIFLVLNASEYQSALVDDPRLKRGSVTISDRTVNIAISKRVTLDAPVGWIGVDINERNVTVSATNGDCSRFSELAQVSDIKQRYQVIRSRINASIGQDRRIAKKILAKFGRRERNRSKQRINLVTCRISKYAKERCFGIKMEYLRGIRKLYRRGNGQGGSFRGRMNLWVFGETQRQIAYKAAWLGVSVHYVNPRGTSRNCPECGSRVGSLPERRLHCAACDKVWDRDDRAPKNIMACAVPQARPPSGSFEGERRDERSDPSSRWAEANLVSKDSRLVELVVSRENQEFSGKIGRPRGSA